VAILYGALVSLMQQDWKKLVAYSSVSHLGFCTLGIFALNHNGIAGSVIQQINHGISTGMLFLIVGVVYERRHTREIKDLRRVGARDAAARVRVRVRDVEFGGVAAAERVHRRVHDSAGRVPGEPGLGGLAVTGIVLGAAYLLWLYQRTMLGEVTNEKNICPT
jgi:NADH-quinone oxidoreductase subunit M